MSARSCATRVNKMGTLFPEWRLIFSGNVPPWCQLHDKTREYLAAGQLSQIGHLAHVLRSTNTAAGDRELAAVWYTVVVCADEPVQVGLPAWAIRDLAKRIADTAFTSKFDEWVHCNIIVPLTRNTVPTKENLLHMFPRKSHPLAGRKANLFLDKMLEDLLASDPTYFPAVSRVWGCLNAGQVTDDQASASLLYADCVRDWFGFSTGLRLGLWAVCNTSAASALSDILKATGVNGALIGAQLCELKTLLGRGVNTCDLQADMERRLVGPKFNLPLAHPDLGDLQEAIDDILNEEMGSGIVLPTISAFWAERFRWCVGGSHNLAANEHWQKGNAYMNNGGEALRWNRRAACEITEHEPITQWRGHVEVSVAEKLEHGKGRAIYSCDTLSYMAFTWLLRTVEDIWASKRVILDPGRDGALGMVNRIRGLSARYSTPVYTMLDYSDFNSQHTLQAQKLVIERVLRRTVHDADGVAAALLSSFDNMYIRYKGRIAGRVGGSLMSGHRGTTFLNSVLNAAYMRVALGKSGYEYTSCLHVGDDVLMITNCEEEGWRAARALTQVGCTLQTSKQSIGRFCFEFLRLAGTMGGGCHGYTARSVAGLASGNWVTEFRSGPLAALHSVIHQARSIINRSDNRLAWRLMTRSTAAITGLPGSVLEGFLSGEIAAAPGPCYRNDGRYLFRYVTEVEWNRPKAAQRLHNKFPNFASRDYIEDGVHYLEREGLRLAGVIPWQAMALSSFRAMELSHREVTGQPPVHTELMVSGIGVRMKQGQVRASTVHTTARKHGLLAHLPILSLLKNVLTTEHVTHLLDCAGVEYDRSRPLIAAWGGAGEGTTVRGLMPYSDASGCAERLLGKALWADTSIRM